MTKSEFIEKLAVELGVTCDQLGDPVLLSSLAAWDSMGRIAVLAFFDSEMGVELEPGALTKCRTVGDLVGLASSRITE